MEMFDISDQDDKLIHRKNEKSQLGNSMSSDFFKSLATNKNSQKVNNYTQVKYFAVFIV